MWRSADIFHNRPTSIFFTVLSVSLPERLAAEFSRPAREAGRSKSDIVSQGLHQPVPVGSAVPGGAAAVDPAGGARRYGDGGRGVPSGLTREDAALKKYVS
jgi:hypothetical protein